MKTVNVFDFESVLADFDKLSAIKDKHYTIQEMLDGAAEMVNLQREIVECIASVGMMDAGHIPATDVANMLHRCIKKYLALTIQAASIYRELGISTNFIAPEVKPVTMAPVEQQAARWLAAGKKKEEKQCQN